MALGAQEGTVIGMVMQQNLSWIAAGTAIGLALASSLTRFLSSLLFGVSPYDPVTFAVAYDTRVGCAGSLLCSGSPGHANRPHDRVEESVMRSRHYAPRLRVSSCPESACP